MNVEDFSWWPYPIFGMSIKNNRFRHPLMFKDATFLSLYEMLRLKKTIMDKSPKISIEEAKKIEDSRSNILKTGCDSYLVIRQKPITPNAKGHHIHLHDNALQRASIIVAFLRLANLAQNGYLCGFTYQAPSPISGVGAIQKGGMYSGDNKPTHYAWPELIQRPFEVSRGEVSRFLKQPPMIKLYEIVIGNKKTYSKKDITRIKQASHELSDAISAQTVSRSVASSVFVVDMLLGEPFKRLIPRVEALLGKKSSEVLNVKEVFGARNNYVHRCKHPERSFGSLALKMALSCLIRYTDLVVKGLNQDQIINYLDLLSVFHKAGVSPNSRLIRHKQCLPPILSVWDYDHLEKKRGNLRDCFEDPNWRGNPVYWS